MQKLDVAGKVLVAAPITGLITGLTGNIYNRYALKKLKRVTHLEKDATDAA